jgi:hypothetical protein
VGLGRRARDIKHTAAVQEAAGATEPKDDRNRTCCGEDDIIIQLPAANGASLRAYTAQDDTGSTDISCLINVPIHSY